MLYIPRSGKSHLRKRWGQSRVSLPHQDIRSSVLRQEVQMYHYLLLNTTGLTSTLWVAMHGRYCIKSIMTNIFRQFRYIRNLIMAILISWRSMLFWTPGGVYPKPTSHISRDVVFQYTHPMILSGNKNGSCKIVDLKQK